MKTETEKEVKYETRNGESKMGNWERKMKTKEDEEFYMRDIANA
jgi:hypothetical protein